MSKKLAFFDMVSPSDETQTVQNDPESTCSEDDDVKAGSRPIELDCESYPVKIYADSRSELWYKSDRKLGLPKSYACIQYISPIPTSTAKDAAMQVLFVRILQKSPTRKLKALINEEGINYKVNKGYRGVSVEVDCLNEKLPLLLERSAECMEQSLFLTTETLFREGKEELLKDFSTRFFEPDQLSCFLTISLRTPRSWNVLECYTALLKIEFNEFQRYLKNNFHRLLYVRSFVQGNLPEIDAIQMVQKCVQILHLNGCKGVSSNAFPILPETVIPSGEHCCRVRSFDPYNKDSCTTNYYQFEGPSLKAAAMIQAFDKIITATRSDGEYPETLKTFEYLVNWDWDLISELTGYYITASGRGKTSVADLDWKIENFRHFWNYTLRNLTDDDLRTVKEYAMSEIAKELVVAGSKEEVSANWNEIVSEKYIFNRQAQQLDILREIRIEEFRAWMVHLTMAKSDRRFRKLTTQVVGYDEDWEDSWDWIRSQERIDRNHSNIHKLRYSLKYLTHLTDEEPRKSTSYFIEDIESYRQRLTVFPNYG